MSCSGCNNMINNLINAALYASDFDFDRNFMF